jgi:hypothetical protein
MYATACVNVCFIKAIAVGLPSCLKPVAVRVVFLGSSPRCSPWLRWDQNRIQLALTVKQLYTCSFIPFEGYNDATDLQAVVTH